MSEFTSCESIKVLTQNGECEIELCLGDITRLTKKEEVDVLMVSAFSGNYVPTPRSVIGALERNLGLCVEDLAKDKEEDLRQLYSCWWSKPLPSHLPYKRLLCFETPRFFSSSPPQVMVSDAFRCLVPILKNEDGSVITPLLNTGSQGFGMDGMMKGMVEAAVRWMKAGLPLRKLKIVLYARNIEEMLNAKDAARSSGYSLTLDTFERMKEKYDMQYMIPKEVKLEFDIYLSYSEADKSIVEKIQEKLKKNKEDVRIFSTRQQLDENSFWQEDMYEVMMKSARVITVLTPSYLQTTACLEQYNIALCCNRKAHRDMLAPFYAITIENMPTYMGLVQYVDCRSQDAESINNACYQIIISLSVSFTRSLSVMNASVVRYDLFLSYSHKDTEIAQRIVKMLQDLNPHLKIFFDVQELKTGKSWQRALYHSIDGSRCLVALMTNNYIKSAVCQEEFNLAMMKHYAVTNHLQLIPFVFEEISYLPPGFKKIPQITTNAETLEEDICTLCSSLVTWLDTGAISEDSTYHKYFVNSKDMKFHVSEKWETLRRNCFEEKFYDAQHTLSKSDFPPAVTDVFKKGKKPSENDERCDIVLSYNEHDKMYADYIMKLLQHFAPKLNIQAKGKNEQERLTMIEEGKRIVPLLSPSYIESPEQVEELHIAIWRSRLSPNLIFPIHLHTLPSRPAYFHLLPCQVNLNDSLWMELALKKKVVLPDEVVKAVDGLSKRSEEFALYMAAYYLLETMERERHEATPQSSSPQTALLNPFCLERNIKDLGSDDCGQVPNTNTNHSGIADNDIESTSELTSKTAIDKAEDQVSDTNKSHTKTNGTSEVTSNAAIKEPKDEVSDTSKLQSDTDATSELTSKPAIDKAENEVSGANKPHSEMAVTSAVTRSADLDKAEDETNDSNKPPPVTEITQEEKEVNIMHVKENSGQDLVVRKNDNETIESHSEQKMPDEHGNVERQQNSSSSKLSRASGHEKQGSSGKQSESKTCNLI